MVRPAPLVAIVDDEESVCRALSRLLRAAGFAVEAHASGEDFLRSVALRPPDCAVLDLRMPHVGGLDVLRALRHAASPVPALILTGDDSPGSRAQASAYGAHAYLRKPVDEAVLIKAIHGALRGRVAEA